MNTQIRSIFLGCILIVASWNGHAMRNDLERIKFADVQLQHASLHPLKYFSISREIIALSSHDVIRNEAWDVEISENADPKGVMYLMNDADPVFSYKNVAFELIDAVGVSSSAVVKYHRVESVTRAGTRFVSSIPYIDVPVSKKKQRIRARFTLIYQWMREAPVGNGLEFLETIPIDKAEFIFRTDADKSNVAIQNNGFDLVGNAHSNGRSVLHFKLKEAWKPSKNTLLENTPSIFVSYTSWGTFAENLAQSFREELSKDVDVLAQVTPKPFWKRELDKKEETRRIAFDLYNWMHGRFTYSTERKIEKKWKPSSLVEILEASNGECTDLSLMYIKLLMQMGIKAEPVSVNVDDKSSAKLLTSRLPVMGGANHVIVYIPEIDEYVDLAGNGKNFGLDSAFYSNTYGLHEFSSEYKLIKPEIISKLVTTTTVLKKVGDKWTANVKWSGSNSGYLTIDELQDRMFRMDEKSQQLKYSFGKNGLLLVPDLKKVARDPLRRNIDVTFSYGFKESPVSQEGFIFKSPTRVLLDIFASTVKSPFASEDRYFCFGTRSISEEMDIHGLDANTHLANLQSEHFLGVNSEFTQKIDFQKDHLHISRKLDVSEKRAYCSQAEHDQQDAFLNRVRAVAEQALPLGDRPLVQP